MKELMFTKEDRSTFPYWFAHWCAFQMTALNCHAWKFKYLFHDMEKPFLKLVMPYKKLQRFHRIHNKHHPEWLDHKLQCQKYIPNDKEVNKLLDKFDFEAAIIDWECCRFTKISCPLDAFGETNRILNDAFETKYGYINSYCHDEFVRRLYDTIYKLGLKKEEDGQE